MDLRQALQSVSSDEWRESLHCIWMHSKNRMMMQTQRELGASFCVDWLHLMFIDERETNRLDRFLVGRMNVSSLQQDWQERFHIKVDEKLINNFRRIGVILKWLVGKRHMKQLAF